jgi:urease accessory protein
MRDLPDIAPDELTLPPKLQRVAGAASVALLAGSTTGATGGARLSGLAQSGSAKAFLPRVHQPVTEVVFLNTAGGLTAGDRLSYALDLGPGVVAMATTQTAERAYRAEGGVARVRLGFRLGAGARLDWLPQETILFDAAALERETEADLAPDASFLMAETVVLGRKAMGETVRRLHLRDLRGVRRAGRPVWADRLHLDDAALAAGVHPAVLGGARAFAVLALVAPGAEAAVGAVRDEIARLAGVEAAASGWDGRLLVRLFASDGAPLRRALAQLVRRLRAGPMPRVWPV